MTENSIQSICVFCGSSMGSNPCYEKSASALADELSSRGIDLVYGGSDIGLMGTVARAMLKHGRKVTGIIPRALHEHVKTLDVSDLIVVETMHERKAAMYERADAFLALPGGIGTFEELLEVYTWSQLGYLEKPTSLLNVNGYFDFLLKQLEHSAREGFMKQFHIENLLVSSSPATLLDKIASYQYTFRAKWEP
jgi:uncharacterized protein (TIGR00730 family)